MHKVTPDKLQVCKGNTAFGVSRFSPSGGESHLVFRNTKNPAVGNGNLVGIAAEGLNCITKTVKGFLYIGTLFLFVEIVFPFFPVIRIAKLFTGM